MIDALTVNFTLIILSAIYFFMAIAIYFTRKEKYLFYYSLSFITLAITYALLLFQKTLPIWISFIVLNMLILVSQLFIVVGIRLLYKQKAFAKRFYLYFLILFFLMIFYTYIDYNINARIISASLGIAFFLLDLVVFVIRHKENVISIINRSIIIVTGLSILNWISRVFFALIANPNIEYIIDQGAITSSYYLIALVSTSIWFGLYILLKTSQSLYKLEITNRELIDLALVDKLTNLANRHYFEHDLKFLIASSKRNKTKMSMLVIDLDRFKLVNDTYGHLVGDDVLKRSAQILKNSIRASDRVFRWGGEEFIIITPDTDNKQAKIVAEKICQNFREAEFDVIGNITVSIGLASYDENENVEDWIKRADLALYQAKQSGRNKWVTWIDNEALPTQFSRITWMHDFESGNNEIDNDHKLLVEYINKLHDLIMEHQPIDTIHEYILMMNEHIHNHFAKEEALLIKFKYRDYMEHRAIHNRILSEYQIIVKKTINGDITLNALMSYLVEKVLIHHILGEDKLFFDVFKSRIFKVNSGK
jgi:diguanylate cyclase (GGDEF)-like protein/hemerythrin-like metal-binding protein